jgi:hypothetical protein
VLLRIVDGLVNQLGIVGLLRRGENERRVGSRILGLVLGDSWMSISIPDLVVLWSIVIERNGRRNVELQLDMTQVG